MTILDGKALALTVRHRIHDAIIVSGIRPGLASILVGQDAASLVYLRVKAKACAEVGIAFERLDFPADTHESVVLEACATLNARKDVHGILVQLPLPGKLSADRIITAIDPKKDVDGFHPANLAALEHGDAVRLPVLVKAVLAFLDAAQKEIRGSTIAILGNSDVFLRPFRFVLTARGATVLTASDNSPALTTRADIVISALGRPGSIVGTNIKKGAMLLDIGTTPTLAGIVGDVAIDSVADRAAFVTPVPGGIGPMTVAMLLENTALAAHVPFSPFVR